MPNFLNNTIVGVKDDNWVFIYYDEDNIFYHMSCLGIKLDDL